MIFNSIPYIFLILRINLISILICISSSQWIYLWLGLELNLLSFIPIIGVTKLYKEIESFIKYFLIQAFSSGVLILRFLIFIYSSNFIFLDYRYLNISLYLFIIRIGVKTGMAPFHFWLPEVIGGLSWLVNIILISLQKIIPFGILYKFISLIYININILIVIVILGVILGGLISLNQTNIRILIAYSSVSHIGWILVGLIISINIFFIYFFSYIVVSWSLIIYIYWISWGMVSSNEVGYKLNIYYRLILGIQFYILGGLPPFRIFFSKVIILIFIIDINIVVIGRLILFFSLFNIFYYITIILNLFIKQINLSFYIYKFNINYGLVYILSLILFNFILLI